ncbi:MFS transporter [Corynebacterium sp.]|jgi:EmrB/QacA subfamily drug resistance transporter|uniref:MFS transporter n=1 Tax=Corynebacterium sp. TaxID=1720 RepID=UPI0025BF9D7A|nr:MFS transporter [Corynebacterium sp.]
MDDAPVPSRRTVHLLVLALGLPTFLVAMGNLVMTFALPEIRDAFTANAAQLQWVLNSYTLVFAALLLPAAVAGDRWGRRRVFVTGLTVFTVASLLAVFNGALWMLVLLRAVQGAGAAAVVPLAMTLLVDHVPETRLPAALGAVSAVNGLGVAVGPVVGGAVTQWGSWPMVFWMNVIVGVVALLLVLWAVDEVPDTAAGDADTVSTVLVGGLVLGLGWLLAEVGLESGAPGGQVLPLLITALAAVALVLRRNRPGYLLGAPLLRDRTFVLAGVVAFLFSAGVFGAVFALSLFIQIVRDQGALDAALWAAPWTLSPVLVAPVAGFLTGKVGMRVVLTGGLVLQVAAICWFAVGVGTMTSAADAFAPALLAGVGMGLVFPSLAAAVFVGRDIGERGLASGVNNTLRQLGTAVGVAVTAAVIAGGGDVTADVLQTGVRPAVLVCAALTALAACTAAVLPSRLNAR